MSIYSENDEQLDRLKETERLLKQASIQEKIDDKGVIESIIDLEILKSVWSALGLYLQKQLKMGRGVNVKQLGQFNFSHPEYNLIGSTNPELRDKQERVPVFLINKEFIKGKVIRQGIYTNQGLRAYGSQGSNGIVQQVMINYTEIAVYANITKEIARSSLDRIIRQIADTYRKNNNVSILIPQIGCLIIKQGIAAVSFNSYLRQVTRNIIKTDLISRIKQNSSLTPHNLSAFQINNNNNNDINHDNKKDDQLSLDSGAKSYLVNTLGINLNTYNKFKNNIQQGYDINNNVDDQASIRSNQSRSNSISYKKKQRPQTSIQRQQSQDQKSQLFTQKLMLSRLSNKALSIRKLKEYLRMKNLDTEEGFIQLVQASIGSVVFNSKLSNEQLMKGIQMLEIELNEAQIQELFTELDVNKDGFVDFKDFSSVIQLENDLLQKQRDVIQINQLETDDVLKRMGLSRDSSKIDVITLREKLMRLNEELDQEKAMKLAQLIMGGQNYIETEFLLVQLEVNDEESKVYNINWYKNILIRLRKYLNTDERIEQLLNDFERYDEKNQGLLDVANYKTVLLKAHLSLSVDEINRMVRYTQKKDDLIDYLAVIKDLQNILKSHSNQDCFIDIQDFASQFLKFLANSPYPTPLQLIKHINTNNKLNTLTNNFNNNKQTVSLNAFLNFLHSIFPQCSLKELTLFASSIDIDQDGQIDSEDLNNFINKYKFYTQSQNYYNKKIDIQINLFPTKELPEEKIDIIIRDLRAILQNKKISYYDLFQRLDKNQDGFISFDEFDKNLENIMRLSQPIKEGLFSYFDRQKIGLIDYQQFLKVMKKVLFIKEIRTTEDNWKWQEEVIDKIREWYQRENINVEQAFKSIDNDFDGFIGKQDLHNFIIDVLKYEPNDINPCKLDRLFKLMDQYKRGQVQFLDFKRLLTENNLKNYINKNQSNYIKDLQHSITNGFKEKMTNSFNWILNAKQQIGLVLSRKFKTIQESFDIISGYKNRLLYDKFKVWIEENQTLNGFDLTDKLLLEVYSSLDPHKKGYLTLNDFQNNFSSYHWQNQMIQEIQQVLENDFENIDKAFQYFIQQDKGEQKVISKEQFIKGINGIFTKRFNNSDLDWYWNTIKQSSEMLSYSQFIMVFDKKQSHPLKHMSKPYSSSQSNFQQNFFTNKDDIVKEKENEYKEKKFADPFKVGEYKNVQEKVRNILRQSDKTLDEVFSEFTDNNITHISNLQFRNLFKKFNLGLTIREFDDLINISDKNTQGLIHIEHFKKQIQLNKIDLRIIQRIKAKISQIRDDIYHYFITPKNAYRIFNKEGNNRMTFLQFQNFINHLEIAAGRMELPFNIINDLFQFIDLRKDQIIDYNEWVQCFKIAQIPSNNQKIKSQQRPSTANNAFNRLKLYQEPVIKQLPNLISAQIQDNVKVEQSKDYDQVMKIIGKNRKYLFDLFKDIETIEKKTIDFQLVKSTIQELLRSNGFQVNDFYWPFLLKFANNKGVIDYKYLLDIYKYKNNKIDQIPK